MNRIRKIIREIIEEVIDIDDVNDDYFSENEYENLISELPNHDDYFFIGMKIYDKICDVLKLSTEDKEKYKKDSIRSVEDSNFKKIERFTNGKTVINLIFLSMKDYITHKIEDGGK